MRRGEEVCGGDAGNLAVLKSAAQREKEITAFAVMKSAARLKSLRDEILACAREEEQTPARLGVTI